MSNKGISMTTIHPTAIVDPKAELASDVTVGPWAWVGPGARIGQGCSIGPRATVDGITVLGRGCRLETGAVVGTPPQDLKYRGEASEVRIGDETIVREYATINRATGEGQATIVGRNCFLMAYSHVAHNCVLEDEVIIANVGTLGGHIFVEKGAIIGGLVAIHQFVRIGRFSMVGGASGVGQDILPFTMAHGLPSRSYGLNRIGLKRRGFSAERIQDLKRAYKTILRSNLRLDEAIALLRQEYGNNEDVMHLVKFIEGSQRGIAR